MKKVLVIIGALFILTGIVGGAITIASSGAFAMSYEEFKELYKDELHDEHKEFTGVLTSTKINATSAEVKIEYSDTDKIIVDYKSSHPNIICNINYNEKTGELKVEETSHHALFFLFWFNTTRSEITVTLPDVYKNDKIDLVDIYLTSGDLKGELPKCENLKLNFTSGKADDITIDCNEADIHITSGDLSVTNRGDRMNKVKYTATSGNAKFYEFAADNSTYEMTSGDLYVQGATGNVYIDKTSGDTTISYAEFDGDIELDCTSGNSKIMLPDYFGFTLDFDCTSGSCEVQTPIEGTDKTQTIKFDDDTKNHIGSDSDRRITVDITSGDVVICPVAE